jgi:hypothetical protein
MHRGQTHPEAAREAPGPRLRAARSALQQGQEGDGELSGTRQGAMRSVLNGSPASSAKQATFKNQFDRINRKADKVLEGGGTSGG